MQEEKTEKLITDEPVEVKTKTQFNRKVLFGILILVGIVVIIASYFLYRSFTFNKNLELGQKFLNEGDYENAIITFDKAINISRKDPQLYILKAQAALGNDNVDLAKETYEELYNQTGNTLYRDLAQRIDFGNSTGNINNDGDLVQGPNGTYLALNSNNSTELFCLTGDNSTKLDSRSRDMSSRPFDELMLWGNNLYYFYKGQLQKLNLNSKKVETIELDGIDKDTSLSYDNRTLMLQTQIYKGKFYFVKEVINNRQIVQTTISTAGLDGGPVSDIFTLETFGRQVSFAISNDKIYYTLTGLDRADLFCYNLTDKTNNHLKEIGITFGQLSQTKNYIYFSASIDSQSCQILQVNTDDNSISIVIDNIPTSYVDAFNTDSDGIYYVFDGKVYMTDLDGENEIMLGNVPEEGNKLLLYSDGRNRDLLTTATDVYLVCYGIIPGERLGLEYKYYKVNKDNPGELEEVSANEMNSTAVETEQLS